MFYEPPNIFFHHGTYSMDNRQFHTTIMMSAFSCTVDRVIHVCTMISRHACTVLIAHTCIISIVHASALACTMVITLRTVRSQSGHSQVIVRSQSGHSQVTVTSWFFTHNLQIRGKPMMPINNKKRLYF